MRRVRSTDTAPERVVRSIVHRLGLRFRLHRRDLPGSPDLVLRRWRTVIFVHGCFWHQHACRRGSKVPSSNREYWAQKLARNVERDRRAAAALRRQGWRVITVWECQTREVEKLRARLDRLIASPRA